MECRFADEPGYSKIAQLYIPLALSWLLMLLDVVVLNAFLARAPEAELSLAAFGIASSLIFMLEAPIYMMTELCIALCSNRSTLRTLRRFYMAVGLVLTLFGAAVFYLPLCNVLLESLMGIPASIAPTTASTLRILLWWVFPIGWRRLYQGVLVRGSRTTMIAVWTLVRLTVLSLGMALGQGQGHLAAAHVAALAAGAGIVAETSVIHWAAHASIGRSFPEGDDYEGVLTLRELWPLFLPMAVTSVAFQLIPPMISAGVASAPMAELSLAAWPVAWGLTMVFWAPAMGLRQISVALAGNKASWTRASRFVQITGLALSGALSALALTPLLEVVLGSLLGVSAQVASLAAPAVRIMFLLPLLYSFQGLYGALLIRQALTSRMRTAKLLNVLVVAIVLVAGVGSARVSGSILAALAMTSGTVVETIWLFWRSTEAVEVLRERDASRTEWPR